MNFNLAAALALALAGTTDARLTASFPFLEAHCEGCQPDYCYPKYTAADYSCYKSGYPKCCTKSKGNCPNNSTPDCECLPGSCSGSEQDRGKRCTRGDGTCKGDLFCQTSTGSCSGTGRCESMTTGCDRSLNQVCGCNGATYDNECEAFSVGVSVSKTGACGSSTPAPTPHDWFPDGGSCNFRCSRDSDCQNGGNNPCYRCGTQHGTIMYQRCYAPAADVVE